MTILGSMPAHFQTHTSWIFSQYLANSLLILFSTAVYHQKCQDTHLLHSLDVSNPLKWSMMHSNPPAMREIRQPVTFSHLSPLTHLFYSPGQATHRDTVQASLVAVVEGWPHNRRKTRILHDRFDRLGGFKQNGCLVLLEDFVTTQKLDSFTAWLEAEIKGLSILTFIVAGQADCASAMKLPLDYAPLIPKQRMPGNQPRWQQNPPSRQPNIVHQGLSRWTALEREKRRVNPGTSMMLHDWIWLDLIGSDRIWSDLIGSDWIWLDLIGSD